MQPVSGWDALSSAPDAPGTWREPNSAASFDSSAPTSGQLGARGPAGPAAVLAQAGVEGVQGRGSSFPTWTMLGLGR